MSYRPHKVSTTLEDSFTHAIGGTAITGLTSGSFTIELHKDGTGNQSTTGITIAEVDAVNNAGEYSVECNGTTSFVSATGTYRLVIYVTANPVYKWTKTYVVDSTGTGAGTIGPAVFNATASDGRVTDGTNPIEGATVYLQNSAGQDVTSVTTDASGLWGPVYLTETVTAYAQKSGFTQAAGTITVSGSTATGPGTDLELSTATGSGTLTLANLLGYARRVASNRTGTLSDTILKEVVNAALQYVATSSTWNYLYQFSNTPLSINGSYTTGTIAVANGSATVTLTGGTFPAWAASGEIEIDGKVFPVSTRDSDTTLSLHQAWQGSNITADTYTLSQSSYDLPNDLYKFGKIYYGRNWPWDKRVSYMEILDYRNSFHYSTTRPYVHAIHQNQVMLWPAPANDMSVPYSYYRRPTELVNDSDVADWDPAHLELLRRSIDLHVAIRFGRTAGEMSTAECQEIYDRHKARAVPNEHDSLDMRSPTSDDNERTWDLGID